MRSWQRWLAFDFALSLLIGMAICVAVAVLYHLIEYIAADYGAHERGIWEGALTVLVLDRGYVFHRRVMRRLDDREE